MAAPLRVLWALTCCFLLQTHLCTGQSLWSPRAVVASVGDEVVLPCLFLPPRDVSGQTLEWTRPDLDPRFVFVWRSYEELTVLRNPAFEGRATLFTNELKHGNISLRLTSVGVRDDGTYRCFVPGLGIDSTVRLHVVALGSSALVSVETVHVWSSAVELRCQSEGWYPPPELQWLDSEGRALSADKGPLSADERPLPADEGPLSADERPLPADEGPLSDPPRPGPGGLYNVSSKLTVKHSGSFTCRVTQSSTNTSTQVTVRLTDEAFGARVLPVVIALAVAAVALLGFVIVLLFLVCRRRRQNPEKHQDEDSPKGNLPAAEEEMNLHTKLEDLQMKDRLKTALREKELSEKIHEKRRQKELSERKPVIIDSFNSWGRSFSLKNNTGQDQPMIDWTVYIEIDDAPALIYEFKHSLTLRPWTEEATVTVWAEGCVPVNVEGLRNKLWEKQPPWNTGETALVSLYNKDKQLVDVICIKMFPE